jgi:LSD1 subclass zinc finger protein
MTAQLHLTRTVVGMAYGDLDEQRYCVTCGRNNMAADNFCAGCGATLRPGDTHQPTAPVATPTPAPTGVHVTCVGCGTTLSVPPAAVSVQCTSCAVTIRWDRCRRCREAIVVDEAWPRVRCACGHTQRTAAEQQRRGAAMQRSTQAMSSLGTVMTIFVTLPILVLLVIVVL